MPVVQVPSPEESTETLTPFQNEVARHVLQAFTAWVPNKKYKSHVDGTFMSIVRLYVQVPTVVYYLVGGNRYGVN